MKSCGFFLSALVAACFLGGTCLGSALEASAKTNSKSSKIYIDKGFVKVTSKGLVVSKGKQSFLVTAIRVDQKGLFVLKKDLSTFSANGPYRAKRAYKCDRCPAVFDSERELLWHYLRKHARNSYDDSDED